MDKAAANSFKKNKDYILVQEVCNAWSNANDEPDADGDDPSTDLGCIGASRSRISKLVRLLQHQHHQLRQVDGEQQRSEEQEAS